MGAVENAGVGNPADYERPETALKAKMRASDAAEVVCPAAGVVAVTASGEKMGAIETAKVTEVVNMADGQLGEAALGNKAGATESTEVANPAGYLNEEASSAAKVGQSEVVEPVDRADRP